MKFNIEIAKILDKYIPADGTGTDREKLRMNLMRELLIIVNNDVGLFFTYEELLTIKTDILHIYNSVSLSELEAHKRNLILNKIKVITTYESK